MYNSQKAIYFTGAICFVITFFGFLNFFPDKVLYPDRGKDYCIIFYKNRFWWISEKGFLLHTASIDDIVKQAFITDVNVNSLIVDANDVNIIQRIEDVLKNPYIAEIKLSNKSAILLKGVVLYFNEWDDLIRHSSKLEKLLKTMEPRTEYFLSSSGLVYKIRGGGGEEK
ncbi:DUF4894 domain-containing protein [Pseudothermotoga sp.]|uniref:DUF4894 domain-containing protein n=1 Tax=Pseudothermotoga sp. TaxID=2033661 RepID=UPI000E904E0B|nr:DUF4894 domain-containing protein [Pseudothermotoga sp.]HBJ80562.1 hypothetical protein [Pseudothermotoga sp.]